MVDIQYLVTVTFFMIVSPKNQAGASAICSLEAEALTW